MPAPVAIKLKLPVTAGSLLSVKSALMVVKLALPAVLTEVRVNALVSVNEKSPPPVKDKIKSVNEVFQVCAAVALRRLILALVAARVIARSVSNKSFSLIDKVAG